MSNKLLCYLCIEKKSGTAVALWQKLFKEVSYHPESKWSVWGLIIVEIRKSLKLLKL